MIKVYNSTGALVWEGNDDAFDFIRKNHLLDATDKIVKEV